MWRREFADPGSRKFSSQIWMREIFIPDPDPRNF
jgi:hypothetical protein